ncbi:MAG: hypothetical protein E6I72_10300 [Chloroflexi bacterium]|nr:MAG: hypothetical protein E6I72_10300 [Chloroflexota bacterium]
MAEVAEDGAVEVDEAEQADPDPDREDHRHTRERASPPLLDRGLDRPSRVAEDVPQKEDEDPGGEGVEKALQRLRQAVHARDRETEEDGGSRHRSE